MTSDPRWTPGPQPPPGHRPTAADPRLTPAPPRATPGGPPRATPGLPAAAAPDPTVLGAWRIEAPLAKGGMGAVFRARHAQTGRPAAIKVILAGGQATATQRQRFAREVEALATLEHPGIVKVLDAGTWGDVPWYAMELVPGPDLAKAQAGLSLRERLEVLAEVARAVGFAHARGYVHRDLKPENVLLLRDGGALRPRVTDFGLAKRVGGEQRLTVTGAVVGTPHHMAPEQVLGQGHEAGPPVDVWALGTMLHQALTGSVPFDAGATLELFAQIVERPPPPLDAAVRAACAAAGVEAGDVDAVRRRALEKDPADRHPTAEALADDLARVLRGEPPASRPVSSAARLVRRLRREPRRAGALLAAALVATGGLAVAAHLGRTYLRARRAEDARTARRLALGQATKDLERALAGGEPRALEAALAGADAACAASAAGAAAGPGGEAPPAGAGAAADEPERAPLDALRRRARLLRGAHGLAAETGAGAAAAEAAARALEADPAASPAERAAAALLAGRAATRRGDAAGAAAAARALAAAGDAGGAALVDGARALAAGDAAGALAPLEAAAAAPAGQDAAGGPDPALEAARADLAAEVRLLRADALLRLGRLADARAGLAAAAQAPTATRGLVARRGAALLAAAAARADVAARVEAGARADAAAPRAVPGAWAGPLAGDALAEEAWRLAARAADEAAADDPRPGRLLLALARPLGRSVEAAERLARLAGRAGAGPALAGLALAARLDLGEDVAAALAASPAADARLRAADLAGLDGDAGAWDALAAAGDDPEAALAAAAAGLRALAERGALDAARRALAARAAAGDGLDAALPRDVPPGPLAARAARDAGWARLLLGDAEGAAASAARALAGRPWDLDAAALLARAGAADGPATLEAAWAREGPALDGPLGRGALLARAAELRARPDLGARAAALLRARLAGDPGAWPAAHLLDRALRAAGQPARPPRNDPLPWSALLVHQGDPPPATPEEAAEARRLVTGEPAATELAQTEQCRRAVALDPLWPRARWELAILLEKTEAASDDAIMGWARYMRLVPSYGLLMVFRLRLLWCMLTSSTPRDDGVRSLERGPDEPVRHVPGLIERYLGLVYGALEDRPRWTRGTDPRALAAHLDRLLGRDARLMGLLPVRAHLAELAGEPGRCDRDLALARDLFGAEKDAQGDDSSGCYVDVFAAAALAERRKRDALRALGGIPKGTTVEGVDKNDLRNLLELDPIWAPLRREPEFKELLGWFAR